LFDTHFLFRKYGIVSKNLEDTMIAAGIIFPDFPKALWFLVSVYCDGERYYKSEGESFYRDDSESKNQREIKDPDSFRRYSAMDSAVLFDIYFKQMEELRRSGNVGPYNRTVRLIEPLIFAQERGILADVEGIISGKKQINDRIKELRSELNRLAAMNGVMNINWSSPDQLKEYFYIVKQEKPYFSRDKKSKEKKRKIKTVNGVEVDMTQWTINEEAKMRLARKGHKEAELLLEMTSLSKLDRTYMNVTLTEDGRFTCSFNPVGTVSGRLSSRKNIFGKGLNMQNLPKEYILDFVSSYLDFTE
jgi:DNA polymerase I-like protein with 3'-5' exonuclease and polymerase domains